MKHNILLFLFVGCQSAYAADSLLRISCDVDSAGAEVTINGKYKGECPLDIQVPEGLVKLSVIKRLDQERFHEYSRDMRIGEGVVKRIEVTLGEVQLTEAGKRQLAERQQHEAEREAQRKREAEQRRIAEQQAEAERQRVAQEAARVAADETRQRQLIERKRMERQAGYTFRDCDTCPDMVVIPAGQFFMGSEDNNDESPVHTVRLPTFAIARTEVTQAQWTALMAGNPSHFPECGPNCPVERITWSAAKEYVRRLSEKTGQTYHLPSESEWEYACRAGVEQKYCGGDDLDKVGWLGGMFTLVAKTHPVATKAPNRWGVYDMSGNVAEWVEDCWHGDYQGAPEDGTARTSGECEQRVMRGGCATLAKQFSRATYRSKYYPHLGYFCNGLRPVRVIPPE